MPQAAAPVGSGNQYEASRYARGREGGVRCADTGEHEHRRRTRFDEPQPARRDGICASTCAVTNASSTSSARESDPTARTATRSAP